MKKTVKKLLIGLAGTFALLIIVALLLVTVFGNRALKFGIETAATKTLNVGVSLEKASLSIPAGKISLKNLIVNNPPTGYQHPHLLELDSADIEAKISSLMTETVNINMIKLDNMKLFIEQKGLSNNLQDILNSLPKSEDDNSPKEPKSQGKNLHIRQIEITGTQVSVKLLPLPGRADTITLTLAPIKLENLGTDTKIDTAGLIAKVLTAVAEGIARQGAGLLPADMLGSLQSVLQEQSKAVIEAGTGIIDAAKDAGSGIIEGGADLGKGATDAIKGLFDTSKDSGQKEKK